MNDFKKGTFWFILTIMSYIYMIWILVNELVGPDFLDDYLISWVLIILLGMRYNMVIENKKRKDE